MLHAIIFLPLLLLNHQVHCFHGEKNHIQEIEEGNNSEFCHSVSELDTGSSCIFPFIGTNGVTHTSCADWTWGGHGEGKKWCATHVDSSGVITNYGFCNADCTPTIFCRKENGFHRCDEDCIEKWKPCNNTCPYDDNLHLCGGICIEKWKTCNGPCSYDDNLHLCGRDCIEKWKTCKGSCSHDDNLHLCGDICTESPCSSCHTVSGGYHHR